MTNWATRRNFCQGLLLIFFTAGIVACTETTVERFRKVPDSRADSAYVKVGVDFSRFRRLMPAPLEIYYPEGPVEPHSEDIERLRQIFRDAFLGELKAYQIVDGTGPTTLKSNQQRIGGQNYFVTSLRII
jgi:hypothetical protein